MQDPYWSVFYYLYAACGFEWFIFYLATWKTICGPLAYINDLVLLHFADDVINHFNADDGLQSMKYLEQALSYIHLWCDGQSVW